MIEMSLATWSQSNWGEDTVYLMLEESGENDERKKILDLVVDSKKWW